MLITVHCVAHKKTIWGDCINYEPWLTFFVRSLVTQKRMLEDKIAQVRSTGIAKLSTTQSEILALFENTSELSMPQIVS